jgi:hypothetical protein
MRWSICVEKNEIDRFGDFGGCRRVLLVKKPSLRTWEVAMVSRRIPEPGESPTRMVGIGVGTCNRVVGVHHRKNSATAVIVSSPSVLA